MKKKKILNCDPFLGSNLVVLFFLGNTLVAVTRQDWLEQTKRDAQLVLAFKSQPLFMIQILTIISVLHLGVAKLKSNHVFRGSESLYNVQEPIFSHVR